MQQVLQEGLEGLEAQVPVSKDVQVHGRNLGLNLPQRSRARLCSLDSEVKPLGMVGASYRHTQVGWVLLIILGVVTVVVALSSPSWTALPTLGILALCLVVFPTLTIIGGSSGIEARFGLGLIRKRFRWTDIRSAKPVRNSWVAGWGIRWNGSGWMFNVSGLDAVELRLKNGRALRIGTDDPRGLHAFIEKQLKGS
jgi:hypothetical protein